MNKSIRHALENAVKRRFLSLARVRNLPAALVIGSTLLATSSAHAAVTLADFADVIAAITAVITIVSAIGVAAMSVVVTVRLFGWIRGALR